MLVEKKEYEDALAKLAELKAVTDKVNSARVTEQVDKLRALLEEELKEILYQEYKTSRGVQ